MRPSDGKRNPRVPPPSRWPIPKVKADGWSVWVQPTMRGYQMKCCDCGLVHEVEFRVFRADERPSPDEAYGPVMPVEDYRVQMRMKRA